MAKNQGFQKALSRFEKQLKEQINNISNEFSANFSLNIAVWAKRNAQNELLKGATPQGADSKEKVINLAKSIQQTHIGGNRYIISAPYDAEGLNLFLEYGTGYRGAMHQFDVQEDSWEYITNKDHIPAFYFPYSRDKYLTDSDNYPVKRPNKVYKKKKSIKGMHLVERKLKNGKVISYLRKNRERKTSNAYGEIIDDGEYISYPQKPNYKFVRSIGIKPVRYMYKTRMKLKEALDGSTSVQQINKKLGITSTYWKGKLRY